MRSRIPYAPLACRAIAFALILWAAAARSAEPPVRIALFGEQTTHSLHRENDPEYPSFLGEILDKDFKIDAAKQAPTGGGMLYGGGSNYLIGNFAHPQGSVLDHEKTSSTSTIRSPEFKLAADFAPNIVILGPFGEHEEQSKTDMAHFTPDLNALIDKCAAFGGKPAILLALPLPRAAKDEDIFYRRIKKEMEAVAAERHLQVIDLWTPFLGKSDEYKDGEHLTVPGRKHMARIVADAILGLKSPRGAAEGAAKGADAKAAPAASK